jgi:hypothetical protein
VVGGRTVVPVPGHCFEGPIGRGRGITVGIIQSDRGDLKVGSQYDHNHDDTSLVSVNPETKKELAIELTVLLPQMRTAPIGAKSKPMAKSVGRTLLGVKMGCQALRRCCLNAVSTIHGF